MFWKFDLSFYRSLRRTTFPEKLWLSNYDERIVGQLDFSCGRRKPSLLENYWSFNFDWINHGIWEPDKVILCLPITKQFNHLRTSLEWKRCFSIRGDLKTIQNWHPEIFTIRGIKPRLHQIHKLLKRTILEHLLDKWKNALLQFLPRNCWHDQKN